VLLRSPDPTKTPLKEKFTSIFESFFDASNKEWPTSIVLMNNTLHGISSAELKKEEEAFWDELFMLKGM